jgi:putative colanic acid biosynthesis acetyltransferase WcaF
LKHDPDTAEGHTKGDTAGDGEPDTGPGATSAVGDATASQARGRIDPFAADRGLWPGLWRAVGCPLFRLTPPGRHGWRRGVLRWFGARVGRGALVSRTAAVDAPWNLDLGDGCSVGDRAILHAPWPIRLGAGAVVSHDAHLCAAAEGGDDPTRPPADLSIRLGEKAWVAAGAFVGPGVTVGDRCVVSPQSVVKRDANGDQVVTGDPARTAASPGRHG